MFPVTAVYPEAAGAARACDFGLVIGQVGEVVDAKQADQVAQLERLGAEVIVLRGDVADRAQLETAVADMEGRFGPIDGVVHAAAATVGGLIQMKDRESVMQELASAVAGTIGLTERLGDQLKFLMLCSSITTGTGGVGQVGYSASNAFLDGFAHYYQTVLGKQAMAVNWSRWQQTGMAVTLEALHEELTREKLDGGMRPSEGKAAFKRLMGVKEIAQVIVSSEHYPTMIREARRYYLNTLGVDEGGEHEAHGRPEWLPPYVAPRNETEEAVVGIWQEVLGINQIGIEDEFSTLGGDSLIALRLISQLRDRLGREVKVRAIYDYPTVQSLAEWLDTMRWLGAEQSETTLATEDDDEDDLEEWVI